MSNGYRAEEPELDSDGRIRSPHGRRIPRHANSPHHLATPPRHVTPSHHLPTSPRHTTLPHHPITPSPHITSPHHLATSPRQNTSPRRRSPGSIHRSRPRPSGRVDHNTTVASPESRRSQRSAGRTQPERPRESTLVRQWTRLEDAGRGQPARANRSQRPVSQTGTVSTERSANA
jgi:hypothetical protein